ncbi:MAG: DUF6659 family protein [Nitrosopumilaceae archaeon]
MSQLTTKQIIPFEAACKKMALEEGVRFVGIINRQGRLIAGGFKEGVLPYESDEKRQMVYMEVMLDLSMRKEFDDTLGAVRSIVSRRDQVTMISIPLGKHLLLISTEPQINENVIITKANEIFRFLGEY